MGESTQRMVTGVHWLSALCLHGTVEAEGVLLVSVMHAHECLHLCGSADMQENVNTYTQKDAQTEHTCYMYTEDKRTREDVHREHTKILEDTHREHTHKKKMYTHVTRYTQTHAHLFMDKLCIHKCMCNMQAFTSCLVM